MRDADAAQSELRNTAQTLGAEVSSAPAFACVFSCMARGPYYYGGNDEDLVILKSQFPNMPIIGFMVMGKLRP